MVAIAKNEDEDEDQNNLLKDKEEQEETYLGLRHIGRTNKMDSESFIISKKNNGEVIKVHFQDNVSNTTKKHAKEAILINNKGKVIVVTKREFNTKTESFHLVLYDAIITVQGAQRVQSFKLDLINHYKSKYNVKSPYEIPGVERFEILFKRCMEKDQDSKFLTISIYNKESKFMIQGTSKNVDSFITDYIEQLIPSQRNFNIEQLSKEEIIIKTLNDTKDKRSNDDKANEAGKLTENTIDLTESESAQNSDTSLSLKDENDLPDDPNDTE